jgi:succinate dehydrogenase/fumarate reductase-like Fe-S protein
MPSRTSEHDERLDSHPILTFSRGRRLKFYFKSKPLYGYEGETVAAALVANGIKVFRHTQKLKRARGFFCAVGKCSSCLMVVDGHPNTMVCMEPLREGCRVEPQEGHGRLA